MSGRLEDLRFTNLSLRRLPVHEQEQRGQRRDSVRGACYVRAAVHPLPHAVLVASHHSVFEELLGISRDQVERSEFLDLCSGAKLLAGCEPAFPCHCGHRYGTFSGQLGDLEALYFGEARGSSARWELQLLGAAQAPVGAAHSGRKPLSSAIRELLYSEALYNLGIPTARAAALVVSQSESVQRTVLHDGEVAQEPAAVLTRIAPSFLRFGSFQTCNPMDKDSKRQGPSAGMGRELLPQLLDFTIQEHFPVVWARHNGDALVAAAAEGAGIAAKQDMYVEFYREVVLRTAGLAAAWNSVGFAHGNLNTDKMSILGVTLDPGQSGFVELWDPEHVSNAHDIGGRYAFRCQSEVCRWNCEKLGEALKAEQVLPSQCLQELEKFWGEYERCYGAIMRLKLGLLVLDEAADEQLAHDLLAVMEHTGADYTNTFRWLSSVPMPAAQDTAIGDTSAAAAQGARDGGFLRRVLGSLPGPQRLAECIAPQMSLEDINMLLMTARTDARILKGFGTNNARLQAQLERVKRAQALSRMSAEAKQAEDTQRWQGWLHRYTARLQREAQGGASPQQRTQTMDSVNPCFILRKQAVAGAVSKAQGGDFAEALQLLSDAAAPFEDRGGRQC
mmetsp:Transcript_24381/g.62567  ORF Transcript_24381/g.62567 Transcript_24381/m.62567 type:complete len:617 (+) Transcript_24381:114-1964(+)